MAALNLKSSPRFLEPLNESLALFSTSEGGSASMPVDQLIESVLRQMSHLNSGSVNSAFVFESAMTLLEAGGDSTDAFQMLNAYRRLVNEDIDGAYQLSGDVSCLIAKQAGVSIPRLKLL